MVIVLYVIKNKAFGFITIIGLICIVI